MKNKQEIINMLVGVKEEIKTGKEYDRVWLLVKLNNVIDTINEN